MPLLLNESAYKKQTKSQIKAYERGQLPCPLCLILEKSLKMMEICTTIF